MASNVWLAGVVTGITSLGLFIALLTVCMSPRLLRSHFRDIVFSLVNGVIGSAGICLYVLNVPIYSRIGSFDIFSAQYTFLYVVCNTVRFVCWYLEFLSTFLLVTFLKRKAIALTLLRYSFHTINLLFSIACFSIAVMPSFPSRSLPGYGVVPPEVWQSVLVHYVFASYYFILKSPAHQVDAQSLFRTYSACFHGLTCPYPPARRCSSREGARPSTG